MISESDTLLDTLRRDGCVHGVEATLTPLSGGISSDIYLVKDGGEQFVVKRALAKLRVKDDWFANVGRNATEQAYLRCVSRFLPEAVPQLRSANPQAGYFCMEFLGGAFANWKKLMLDGVCETAHAAQAGKILGTIHRQTAGDSAVANEFATTADFQQLRIEPYLLTTGSRHPALQEIFEREAGRLAVSCEALVHGDFSPKNILICEGRMVVLDCEVAWFGDPVFDVAFLLNHLFLKSLHHAPADCGLEKMIVVFWRAYKDALANGLMPGLEARLVPLLLMLLLARVDGKSPAEYLTPPKQQFIRDFVYRHLPLPPNNLAALSALWFLRVYELAPSA